MNSILADYGLVIIALIVAIVTLVLITMQDRQFRKFIESDEGFLKWKKDRNM